MAFLRSAHASVAGSALLLALLGSGAGIAGADQPPMSGPHLFVGEQYDISGGVIRAIALPIVGGLVQRKPDAVYRSLSATLTTQPDGDILSTYGSEIETVNSQTGKIVSLLNFEPVHKSLFPSATELHVGEAGRLFAAFLYERNGLNHFGLAIYPPGARGNRAPSFVLPIAGRRGIVSGIATRGDAVYVSDGGRGTIDVFAPIGRPMLIGEITGLKQPGGLVFDSKGELYACNVGDGTVVALRPSERGTVHPDRVISVTGHRLCSMSQQFFDPGNELAIYGETLFVGADNTTSIFELQAGVAGPQSPLTVVPLAERNNPWHAIDLAVGPAT